MNPAPVLRWCVLAGVRLRFAAGRVEIVSPPGAASPELREAVASIEGALVDQYEERAAIREHCGRMDREEAERQAARDVLGAAGCAKDGSENNCGADALQQQGEVRG